MTSTEIQQQTSTWVQIGEAVPPNHAFPGVPVISHVCVEISQQDYGSPTGALYRIPFRVSKKAEYTELLFSTYAQTIVRVFPPTTHWRREATLSSTGIKSNIAALSRSLVSIPTPACHLTPWSTREKSIPYPVVWIQRHDCA